MTLIKTKKCQYCGEFPAITEVPDPNGGLKDWKVCGWCEKIIPLQKEQSLLMLLTLESKFELPSIKKRLGEIEEEIAKISKESGMESFCISLERKQGANPSF